MASIGSVVYQPLDVVGQGKESQPIYTYNVVGQGKESQPIYTYSEVHGQESDRSGLSPCNLLLAHIVFHHS